MKTIEYHDDLKTPATKRITVMHINWIDVVANADTNTKWVWVYDGLLSIAASLDILKELANVSGSTVETE